MFDPRMQKLARNLVRTSCRLRKGEKVLIEAIDVPDEMVELLIRETAKAEAHALVTVKRNRILRELYRASGEEAIALAGEVERFRMERVDAYIGIRGSQNVSELSDVPPDKLKQYQTHWWSPVHIEVRVPKTRWVVLRWPTASMAQQAKKSTEAFEDFYFAVCNLDYRKMGKAMEPLVELMDRTDEVRLVGPGTDLTFSIAGIPAVPCAGDLNIPDGEVFTAPVRDSANGKIRYNTPSLYMGTEFSGLEFTFKKGKITRFKGNPTDRLKKILDTDEGARYLGEFAMGVNPFVNEPMLDTLFDEKIAGSIHLTPGNSYDEAPNGKAVRKDGRYAEAPAPRTSCNGIRFARHLTEYCARHVSPGTRPRSPRTHEIGVRARSGVRRCACWTRDADASGPSGPRALESRLRSKPRPGGPGSMCSSAPWERDEVRPRSAWRTVPGTVFRQKCLANCAWHGIPSLCWSSSSVRRRPGGSSATSCAT
jgi:aminopeptidase